MVLLTWRCVPVFQYGRSDSYRVATTTDKDEKESSPKKAAKGGQDGKDLDDLKKEVPLVSTWPLPVSCLGMLHRTCLSFLFGNVTKYMSISPVWECFTVHVYLTCLA